MKLSASLVILLVCAAVAQAEAACPYPQAPQSVPNGGYASKDEMLAAQQAIKDYRDEVENSFLPCLDQEKAEALANLDPNAANYQEMKTLIESIHAKRHNAAIDELQAMALRWSEEIKAFNARNEK
jgi:hypothetical protein